MTFKLTINRPAFDFLPPDFRGTDKPPPHEPPEGYVWMLLPDDRYFIDDDDNYMMAPA